MPTTSMRGVLDTFSSYVPVASLLLLCLQRSRPGAHLLACLPSHSVAMH